MSINSKNLRSRSKLRKIRMSRGLLQIDLARLSGVTQAAISRMEKNGVKRADKAKALALALKCTIDDIC